MRIGYARVSTRDQNLELQFDALNKAGCKRIFTDKLSGVQVERPGLKEALSHLREADTLVVWKLDRLGRSVKGLVSGSVIGFLKRQCAENPGLSHRSTLYDRSGSSGFRFALQDRNLARAGHLTGRQSLANKNIDSAEAQPYAFWKPTRFWQRSANC
jgi:hypothetical protein